MKSGTSRIVVALACYVLDANGRQCVAAAMLNDERIGDGKGRTVLGARVDWVAKLTN